jgi:hypothetical protein
LYRRVICDPGGELRELPQSGHAGVARHPWWVFRRFRTDS